MRWFVTTESFPLIARAYSADVPDLVAKRDEWCALNELEIPAMLTADGEPTANAGVIPNLKIAGDVAEIRVEGMLTESPDFFLWLFGIGNTAFSHIRTALAAADADPTVKRISMFVDSPGGTVDGLFETLDALALTSKPITVRARRAQSAAFAIGAVAGKITAVNEAVPFGSIGVATEFRVRDDIVAITSREAPDKRPDVTTPEGVATVQDQLDDVHDIFAERIAKGRGTTVKDVNQNFGRGRTVLARDAKRFGMIDTVAKPKASRGAQASDDLGDAVVAAVLEPEPPAAEAATTKDNKMDIETLRREHPEIASALIAEGNAAGVKQERSRCSAHVKMGKRFKATDVAFGAIVSGASVQDDEVFADYQTAGDKQADNANRQADSNAAAAALEGAAAPTTPTAATPDLGDSIVAHIDGSAVVPPAAPPAS